MRYTLTTGSVAKLCEVAPRTVAKWCMRGLKHHKIPLSEDRRIDAVDLVRFLREHCCSMSIIHRVERYIGLDPLLIIDTNLIVALDVLHTKPYAMIAVDGVANLYRDVFEFLSIVRSSFPFVEVGLIIPEDRDIRDYPGNVVAVSKRNQSMMILCDTLLRRYYERGTEIDSPLRIRIPSEPSNFDGDREAVRKVEGARASIVVEARRAESDRGAGSQDTSDSTSESTDCRRSA